jgi:hypothetical protein
VVNPIPDENNVICVKSFNNPAKLYEVSVANATCTCLDHIHRKSICKHMNSIIENLEYSQEVRDMLIENIKKNFQ